jgi:hypothetical protein
LGYSFQKLRTAIVDGSWLDEKEQAVIPTTPKRGRIWKCCERSTDKCDRMYGRSVHPDDRRRGPSGERPFHPSTGGDPISLVRAEPSLRRIIVEASDDIRSREMLGIFRGKQSGNKS